MSFNYKFLLIILFSTLVSGCGMLAIKEQQRQADSFCRLLGTVTSELKDNGNLVILLFRHKGDLIDSRKNWNLVDHYTLEQPGQWGFYSHPGRYYLTAFQDINQNQFFERSEPIIPLDLNKTFSCHSGELKKDINLFIPKQGRIPGEEPLDITNLQSRSADEQMKVSLGQSLAVGEIISLSDQRFSSENAKNGLWRPFDFIWEAKPGIYFLERYDQNKTPVLFIHGMTGTPREFDYLINRLDRSNFQPWVFFYPSGARLDSISLNLNRLIAQLKARYRFQKLIVVAHSMGGLIARNSILKYTESNNDGLIRLFVSISTPWKGYNNAQLAVDYAPVSVYSWLDMAPTSQFLTDLFNASRQLPASLPYHLIFTYLANKPGDGVISIESQLRQEAQDNADRLYGFKQSHTGVLENAKVSELINRLLDNAQ